MEEEITLKDYFNILFKRKWIVVITLLLAVAVAVAASMLTAPVYKARALVQLNKLVATEYNTPAIQQVVQTDTFLKEAKQLASGSTSVAQLKENMQAERMAQTNLISFSVIDENPKKAAVLADALAEAFVAKIRRESGEELLQKQADQLESQISAAKGELGTAQERLAEVEADNSLPHPDKVLARANFLSLVNSWKMAISNLEMQFTNTEFSLMEKGGVKIMSEAEVPESPIGPRIKTNMAIAVVLGLVGGIGLAFLIEYFAILKINGKK